MNDKKFYINLALFIIIPWVYAIFDMVTGRSTDQHLAHLTSFFIVWNWNHCKIDSPRKSKAPAVEVTNLSTKKAPN